MQNYASLVVFVVLVSLAAITGAKFSPGPWYLALNKPWWTPPGWVFPVVWTILYVMIAIAGWKVWQAQGFGQLLVLWLAQLVLNAAWSWIMFGQKEIGWALVDAGGMWLLIAAFVVMAWPVSQAASILFMPYLLWVTIAFTLNLWIWRANG